MACYLVPANVQVTVDSEGEEMANEQSWGFDQGVGATALWIAHARAEEAKECQPLFVDPFAQRFSGQRGGEVERAICAPLAKWYQLGRSGVGLKQKLRLCMAVPAVARLRSRHLERRAEQPSEDEVQSAVRLLRQSIRARTQFFDAQMVRAVRDLGIRQIVTMASGCDCRCLRLAEQLGSGVRHFLVYQPDVVNRYAHVLQKELDEQRNIQLVGVKFGEERWTDRIRELGFDPSQRTFWLVEGLTMYLDGSTVQELFCDVGTLSAPGSVVSGDYVNDGTRQHPAFVGMMDSLRTHGCEWTWSAKNSRAFAQLLAGGGLKVQEDMVASPWEDKRALGFVDAHMPHVPQYHAYVAVKA